MRLLSRFGVKLTGVLRILVIERGVLCLRSRAPWLRALGPKGGGTFCAGRGRGPLARRGCGRLLRRPCKALCARRLRIRARSLSAGLLRPRGLLCPCCCLLLAGQILQPLKLAGHVLGCQASRALALARHLLLQALIDPHVCRKELGRVGFVVVRILALVLRLKLHPGFALPQEHEALKRALVHVEHGVLGLILLKGKRLDPPARPGKLLKRALEHSLGADDGRLGTFGHASNRPGLPRADGEAHCHTLQVVRIEELVEGLLPLLVSGDFAS